MLLATHEFDLSLGSGISDNLVQEVLSERDYRALFSCMLMKLPRHNVIDHFEGKSIRISSVTQNYKVSSLTQGSASVHAAEQQN